ncbi:MAG: AIR synthase related protein [Lachnospiraceae bacterium]
MAQGPGIGQDCAIVRSEGQKFCVLHTQAFTVERMEKIEYQVHCGVNNLCCSGGEAVALMMAVMMPEQGEEDLLRSIMDSADTVCRECGIQLSGGHTEIFWGSAGTSSDDDPDGLCKRTTSDKGYPSGSGTGDGRVSGFDWNSASGQRKRRRIKAAFSTGTGGDRKRI